MARCEAQRDGYRCGLEAGHDVADPKALPPKNVATPHQLRRCGANRPVEWIDDSAACDGPELAPGETHRHRGLILNRATDAWERVEWDDPPAAPKEEGN